mmetsp:Transcript_40714/g.73359  ORF Transcript_40714/g.73359 Transcript_40714/m.73359 type:complete len:140 (+) Transcript_40714:54-473(+)
MADHAGVSVSGKAGYLPTLFRDWGAVKKDGNLKSDSKVPLSIERTLLRWLRSAVILSSLSAFLSSFHDPATRVNGILLGLVALLFVCLPVAKFVRRSLDLTKAIAVQPMTDRGLVHAMGFTTAAVLAGILLIDLVFSKR